MIPFYQKKRMLISVTAYMGGRLLGKQSLVHRGLSGETLFIKDENRLDEIVIDHFEGDWSTVESIYKDLRDIEDKAHDYKVTCPYCNNQALLTSSEEVYSGRDYGMIHLCKCIPGWAYVGCHKGTNRPLGRLADKELRYWKVEAHAAFDPLWKGYKLYRKEAYVWLSRALGISKSNCHIGKFDIDMCKRVIEVCPEFAKTKGEV